MRRRPTALLVVLAVALLGACDSGGPSRGTAASSTAGPAAPPSTRPPPTARPHVPHTGGVLVVGDSLTVGADRAGLSTLLRQDGWAVEVDAEEGRSTRTGIAVVRARDTVPALVVVELGTNPSSAIGSFPDEVHQMLAALAERGARRVVWVTPHFRGDDRYDDKDRALADAAAADPSLTVADWHALAAAHPSWSRPDGIHYSDEGYANLAAFIADAIDAAA